ncbi:hypothetical protein NPIL_634361 [Nephila pilipes]|uniref:Uncharacterized protein n=1 Tax=Nephila pilipes TaxID=299642 RepID=A0A8X6ME09_NEPPI|nr:hypothetical protein NPIL_634361 [Nephila pilipes]
MSHEVSHKWQSGFEDSQTVITMEANFPFPYADVVVAIHCSLKSFVAEDAFVVSVFSHFELPASCPSNGCYKKICFTVKTNIISYYLTIALR